MADNQKEKITRLVQIMSEKNIKQGAMAELLGIGRPNLSAIINGRENRVLPYGTSYILECELGVNRFWFEDGKEPKYLSKKETSQSGGDAELIYQLKERIKEKDEIIAMLKEKLSLKRTEDDLDSNRIIQGQLVTKEKSNR